MTGDVRDHCDLRACRICTGCYHGNHGACRGSVHCPDTGAVRPCVCCGVTR